MIKDDYQIRENQKKDKLFRMLDRGIDDMEAGRELPLEEAFEKIAESVVYDGKRHGKRGNHHAI